MYKSPRGTPKNLFDVSMTEHAYVIRTPHEERRAGRSKESVVTVTEKCEQEDGRGPKGERLEEGKRRKTASRGREAEPESQDPAPGNGESEKASHVPGGTWLFQVRDYLRGQLSEVVGKFGRYWGGGLGTMEHSTKRE
ncbi:hypothetical protein NDU88_001210 [Pleurodeles waltl]|uniref:Uncharacterized protein n=1 Tax=Pleurodeles waltl TaxID=8319 RepID=A0AAV7MMT9_PLEWA|nr:hypothetical protein NDU88_001210 [Pleurodeles waltl]